MAGHFLLNNISQQDLKALLTLQPGACWSALYHGQGVEQGGHIFPGWTVASRSALQHALYNHHDGHGEINRNNLPPHRYLSLRSHPLLQNVLQSTACVNELCRPHAPWFGAVALSAAAAEQWARGNKVMAVVEQANPNPVSIEIYHLNGRKMR